MANIKRTYNGVGTAVRTAVASISIPSSITGPTALSDITVTKNITNAGNPPLSAGDISITWRVNGFLVDDSYEVGSDFVQAFGTYTDVSGKKVTLATEAVFVETPALVGNTSTATIASFTSTDPIFDSDLLRGNNLAVIPLSGTTDAANGSQIEARAIADLTAYKPQLLKGETGSETPQQLLALIKTNTPAFFDDWVATDTRTAAEIVSDLGDDRVYIQDGHIHLRGSAELELVGCDLGEIGVRARDASKVYLRDVKTSGEIWNDGGSLLICTGLRHDNSYYRTSGINISGAMKTIGDGYSLFLDCAVRRHACDTTKFDGARTDCAIQRWEGMTSDVEVTVYDGATNYAIGARVHNPADNIAFANKIWTKLTNAGAGTAPDFAGSTSSTDWGYADYHFDDAQFAQPNFDARLSLISIAHDNADRTAGPTGPFKTVHGTASFFTTGGVAGSLTVRGLSIVSNAIPWQRINTASAASTLFTDVFINGDIPLGLDVNIDGGTYSYERFTDTDTSTLVSPASGIAVTGNAQPTKENVLAGLERGYYETPWQAVGAASGGTWTGSINATRSAEWLKPQARVAGSTVVSTGANRFGVGLVIYWHRQSNGVRMMERASAARPTPAFIDGDVQRYFIDNRGDPDVTDANSVIVGPEFVTQADKLSNGIAAYANIISQNAPGLKVCILADNKGGRSTVVTLDDNNTDRLFSKSADLIAAGTADGQIVGGVMVDHWNGYGSVESIEQTYFGGAEGIPLFPGAEHSFQEILPELLTGRTQMVLAMSGGIFGGASSELSTGRYDMQADIANFVAAYPTRAQAADYMSIASTFDGTDPLTGLPSDLLHYSVDDEYGVSVLMAMHAASMLRAGGLLNYTQPMLDMAEWEANGAYCDVWWSGGDITTAELLDAAAESRAPVLYPLNPSPLPGDADPTIGQRQVLGIQFGDYTMPLRTEIVDAQGNPATSGRIRVYPDSGTFDQTTSLFAQRGYSGTNFPGNSGVDAYELLRFTEMQRHIPIADVGIQGVTLSKGLPLAPNPTEGFINAEKPFAAGVEKFRLEGPVLDANAVPIFTTGQAGGPPTNGVTIHAMCGFEDGSTRLLQDTRGDSWFRAGYSPTVIALEGRSNAVDNLFTAIDTGLTPLTANADGMIEVLVHISLEASRMEFYVKDVNDAWVAYDPANKMFDNSTFAAANEDLSGAAEYRALNASSSVEYRFVRYWLHATGAPLLGANVPSGPVWRAIESNSASGAFLASDVGAVGSSGRFDVIEDAVVVVPNVTGFVIDTSTQPDTFTVIDPTDTWSTLHWQLDDTATYASVAAMQATTGSAYASGTLTRSSTEIDLTALADATKYLHVYGSNAVGDQTTPPVSQEIIIDNTAPVLTSPTATGGSGGLTWGVQSDSIGGTIYAAARLAANPQLSRDNIRLGTGDAVATGTDATPTADAANGGAIDGLAAGSYVVDMYHDDGFGNLSAVVSSTAVTVTAYSQLFVRSAGTAPSNLRFIADAANNTQIATYSIWYRVPAANWDGLAPINIARTSGNEVQVLLRGTSFEVLADLRASGYDALLPFGALAHVQVNVNTITDTVNLYVNGVDITFDVVREALSSQFMGFGRSDFWLFDSETDLEFADWGFWIGETVSNAALWNGGSPLTYANLPSIPSIYLGGTMTLADYNAGAFLGDGTFTLRDNLTWIDAT